jgi:hypothetical protein
VAELTNHDLELEKAMRVKAEQEVCCLKEETRKLEFCLADVLKAVHVEKDKLKKISSLLTNLKLYLLQTCAAYHKLLHCSEPVHPFHQIVCNICYL